MPLRLVYSHSTSDTDLLLRDALHRHLQPLSRTGHLHLWHEGLTTPGEDRDVRRAQAWQQADGVLVLLSPDYLADDRCFREMTEALAGPRQVVPILLRPCMWCDLAIAAHDPLPRGLRPITDWSDRDEALDSLVRDLRTRLSPRRRRPMVVLGIGAAALAALALCAHEVARGPAPALPAGAAITQAGPALVPLPPAPVAPPVDIGVPQPAALQAPARPPVARGALVVRSESGAIIQVDARRRRAAPPRPGDQAEARFELPARRYRVTCFDGGREKQVEVNVQPGATHVEDCYP